MALALSEKCMIDSAIALRSAAATGRSALAAASMRLRYAFFRLSAPDLIGAATVEMEEEAAERATRKGGVKRGFGRTVTQHHNTQVPGAGNSRRPAVTGR